MSTLFDHPFEDAGSEPAGDGDRATVHDRRRTIFSVSELTSRIRGLLEPSLFDVWVEGEISNAKVWNTGHLYFTLKDSGAQIKAVMFRSALRYLRFRPEDGQRVVARGRITVYDPKGEYQIVCEFMEPHGLGALQLAFDQLKRRLQAEGLFDNARKRPLPELPRKIGIVTSTDGAAIRDIIQILQRRYPNAHLIVRPTRVQGDGAAADIARGLREISRIAGVDVVIVGRGGGSVEDLWAFNEEAVARAIARCPVPVISAIGHETDFTIADFVADLRAPTPSAAAELVVARKDDFYGRIDRLAERALALAGRGLHLRRARVLELVRRPGLSGLPARLAVMARHAGELRHDLHRLARGAIARRERHLQARRTELEAFDLRYRLSGISARLVGADTRLSRSIGRRYQRAAGQLGTASARLDAMSPLGVLARGYAVCWADGRGEIVRDAARVSAGEHVRITLHRGELDCEVHRVELADRQPARPSRAMPPSPGDMPEGN